MANTYTQLYFHVVYATKVQTGHSTAVVVTSRHRRYESAVATWKR